MITPEPDDALTPWSALDGVKLVVVKGLKTWAELEKQRIAQNMVYNSFTPRHLIAKGKYRVGGGGGVDGLSNNCVWNY